MIYHRNTLLFFLFFVICLSISCNQPDKLREKQLVEDPKTIDHYISENLKTALSIAVTGNGKVDDSLHLPYFNVVEESYYVNGYMPLWSDTGIWRPATDHLLRYLDTAAFDGLFKTDYHYEEIHAIKQLLDKDSIKRTDAVLWTRADLLLTDAFMHILCDLKQGRLVPDKDSWKNDTTTFRHFFMAGLDRFLKQGQGALLFREMQPLHAGYMELKKGIPAFIDSMDTRMYTYLVYPYKKGDPADSLKFIRKLQLRLSESDVPDIDSKSAPDSATMANAITRYQKNRKMKPDGKISAALVKTLNLTDRERFTRIAITLDRYKQLPDSMPEKYIWVNLPGFYLQLWQEDTLQFTSKIICGKPITPTPHITSAISDLIIYPTWTVPESIIKKELLPGLKRNPGYLARKGLDLYNYKGEKVDPATINWAKYSKGIPFKVQQGSGDDNALGVIKFNFENPYFVYLHDTNQRYLFKNSVRALSHGCVRVQEWQQLASYIARNDSANLAVGDSIRYTPDSIRNWIANKERHRIQVKNKIPLFIRYFSCEGINGQIRFYDDIYGEDKSLKEKYFAGK